MAVRLNKYEARPTPRLRFLIKVVLAGGDSLRDTGESGDAYDAEAQAEAELASNRASKP